MNESGLIIRLWLAGTILAILLFALVVVLIALINKRAKAQRLERQRWDLELQTKAIAARLEERELLMDEFSKEINDNIGQLANIVRMHLKIIEKDTQEAAFREAVIGAMRYTNCLLENIRSLSYLMDGNPIHEEGLFNAIGWQIDHIRRTHAVEIDLEADEKEIPLTAQQQVVVYRIAQGAINNALAHSQVSHIVIRIHSTEQLFILEIVDNGTGISSQEDNAGTMGFGNMMQRAQLLGGRLAVQMAARKGTTVLLEVPAAPFDKDRLDCFIS